CRLSSAVRFARNSFPIFSKSCYRQIKGTDSPTQESNQGLILVFVGYTIFTTYVGAVIANKKPFAVDCCRRSVTL
ncbi:MAG TPA: hypothetical protein VFT06_06555, partial [Flavisolibacter sp.]|nr:hypothetical protein [Flavisolibacter sp.]